MRSGPIPSASSQPGEGGGAPKLGYHSVLEACRPAQSQRVESPASTRV